MKHKEQQEILGLLHDHVAPQFFISKTQFELFIESITEGTLEPSQQDAFLKGWRALHMGYAHLRELMATLEEGKSFDATHFFPTFTEVCTMFAAMVSLQKSIQEVLQALPKHLRPQVEKSKKLGICASELFMNTLKHSKQRHVKLDITTDGKDICLHIEAVVPPAPTLFAAEHTHDTCKNTAIPTPEGTGLKMMRARLKEWGGNLVSVQKAEAFSSKVYLPLSTLENEYAGKV